LIAIFSFCSTGGVARFYLQCTDIPVFPFQFSNFPILNRVRQEIVSAGGLD
jgi:hypothetical protein